MRSPRIAILVLFFAASLFLLCRSVVSLHSSQQLLRQQATPLRPHTAAAKASSFTSFLSFTTPFTLFPPNAAISLTDDNSTFFPARPAAFGAPLPAKGLSGQLWIGSGFADEALLDVEGEGELGCSDLPGWSDGTAAAVMGRKGTTAIGLNAKAKAAPAAAGRQDKHPKRSASKLPQGPPVDVDETTKMAKTKEEEEDGRDGGDDDETETLDDGTDDYLHRTFSAKAPGYEMTTVTSSHADIQSIQETAEITGKVVLLSRGGCGFLEKVKWAQRRGAIGVIVGDNQRGGPLIQMFARGDTSNVTIPAIFTSRTTAHLLSSLMQPGSFAEDMTDEHGHSTFKIQQQQQQQQQQQKQTDSTSKNKKTSTTAQKSSAAQEVKNKKTTAMMMTTTGEGSPLVGGAAQPGKAASKEEATAGAAAKEERSKQPGWFARLFGFDSSMKAVADRSRPPSSGQHDWVLVDDWSDEKDKVIRSSLEKASKSSKSGTGAGAAAAAAAGQKVSGDGFQIGVQDWRDPDLVDTPSTGAGKSSPGGAGASSTDKSTKESAKKADKSKDTNNGPKGGSITPGSGQYVPQSTIKDNKHASTRAGGQHNGGGTSGGLMSRIFGDGDNDGDDNNDPAQSNTVPNKAINTPLTRQPEEHAEPPIHHEGLWVTITPTGSTAPFFDTLLVLVISPLITLTVVYALLILRAKIRRRRWRAPKSVVERLPVRTYHTVAATSSSHTSRVPSPTSSSPTTPLLQNSARPRPRSRTATGVPDADDLLRVDTALRASASPSRPPAANANNNANNNNNKPSQWKKYMGRQVECVVCLEEYVDGVSRVMSLPCGHEFHAECITPWLTTRRRTCPICKGDVVRSLAKGSPSSPRYEPYHDDSDSDMEPEASGSASRFVDHDADVEQGFSPASSPPRSVPDRSGRPEGWLGMLSSSFGTSSYGSHSFGANSLASSPPSHIQEGAEDRDR